MARLQAILLGLILLPILGCNDDKIARLEKQNEELKAQMAKQNAAADFDLQAKCSNAAKLWFRENWGSGRDKDDILLDFSNHYNKASNQCFVQVVDNRRVGTRNSWSKHMSLWDVFENSMYGDFSEVHTLDDHFKDEPNVVTCEVLEKKCSSADQFNSLVQRYMNN
jgi:hypothetical protein